MKSTKSNGREPKSYLGRVFNFKFANFASKQCKCMMCTQPILELKMRPQFCPLNQTLSGAETKNRTIHFMNAVYETGKKVHCIQQGDAYLIYFYS
jgi:hypothetical protein